MTGWQPATRRTLYGCGIVAIVIAATAGSALLLTDDASAQTDMTLDTLNVTGTDRTVSGNVTAVRLTSGLDYQPEVPDATRRIVKLQVGTTTGDFETITYQQTRDPAGTASGSVQLSGSVLDHSALSASDFQPPVANTTSQELVVRAVLEVHRSTGDVVTHTVTDTATVTLHDDGTLSATVGGTGNITVQTDG
jgi:hypothetical protein